MFWACTAELWRRLLGWYFLPFGLYFASLVYPAFNPLSHLTLRGQHASQVGLVVMIYAFLLSALLVYPNYFLFCAHKWVRAGFIGYITWYVFLDYAAPESGTRFLPWTRRLPFWNKLADYFPVRLHKSCDLDPRGNYLFGYHPHGVIGVGALITFATNATGFDQAFPGLDLRLLTLAINFYFPFTREVLMALGINSVTKESVVTNLTRKPGASVAIVVGGAAEALDARPGWAVLTLARRKGFVKMALKTGASLVPVFAFGENDIFDQVDNPDGGALRRFQLWCKQLIGITPPLLYGRNLSRGVFRRFTGAKTGVLPKRESIEVVVGAPIACPKTSDPTSAQIDEYHARYVAALRDLYETHRRLFHKLKRHGSHDDLVKRMRQMKSMRLN
jgi:2-acylglycerol O-acyltransferase 2